MKIKLLASGIAIAMLFGGCAKEMMNDVVSNMVDQAAQKLPFGSKASQVAKGRAIGAQLANRPSALGVSAVSHAISRQNQIKNLNSFNELKNLFDSGKLNRHYTNQILDHYNKKYGTNFKTIEQLQDFVRVQEYNKEYGTNYKSVKEILSKNKNLKLQKLKRVDFGK